MKDTKVSINPASILFYAGMGLVTFSAVILFAFNWGDYDDPTKLLIITLSTLIFYLVGFSLYLVKILHEASFRFFTLASIIAVVGGIATWTLMLDQILDQISFLQYWPFFAVAYLAVNHLLNKYLYQNVLYNILLYIVLFFTVVISPGGHVDNPLTSFSISLLVLAGMYIYNKTLGVDSTPFNYFSRVSMLILMFILVSGTLIEHLTISSTYQAILIFAALISPYLLVILEKEKGNDSADLAILAFALPLMPILFMLTFFSYVPHWSMATAGAVAMIATLALFNMPEAAKSKFGKLNSVKYPLAISGSVLFTTAMSSPVLLEDWMVSIIASGAVAAFTLWLYSREQANRGKVRAISAIFEAIFYITTFRALTAGDLYETNASLICGFLLLIPTVAYLYEVARMVKAKENYAAPIFLSALLLILSATQLSELGAIYPSTLALAVGLYLAYLTQSILVMMAIPPLLLNISFPISDLLDGRISTLFVFLLIASGELLITRLPKRWTDPIMTTKMIETYVATLLFMIFPALFIYMIEILSTIFNGVLVDINLPEVLVLIFAAAAIGASRFNTIKVNLLAPFPFILAWWSIFVSIKIDPHIMEAPIIISALLVAYVASLRGRVVYERLAVWIAFMIPIFTLFIQSITHFGTYDSLTYGLIMIALAAAQFIYGLYSKRGENTYFGISFIVMQLIIQLYDIILSIPWWIYIGLLGVSLMALAVYVIIRIGGQDEK